MLAYDDKFLDRRDAGKKLAVELEKYRVKGPIVLAIPRGGVEVGYQVARHLDADLSLIVTRKLPLPDNPEAGFGAVAEDGSTYIYPRATRWVSDEKAKEIKHEQVEEIKRRIDVLRNGEPLPDIRGRTVILVDDGIAMGSTMKASIAMCRNQGAEKIIVAVPVTGTDRKADVGRLVHDIIVLETPHFFRAVAQVYRNWYDVSDREVLKIMERRREHES